MKHDKNVTFIRVRDGREITADEAYNKDGILKSGVSMRTSLQFMDSVPKSGFYIADDGQVYKDGKPYKVPLELCDDGVARPTLDKKRKKKVLGPNGETEDPDEDDPETERIASDAAPALLADGTTIESHRPHFGVVERVAQENLEALRVTLDYIDSQRFRGNDAATTAHVADVQSVEDCYAAYDEAARTAYLKGKA